MRARGIACALLLGASMLATAIDLGEFDTDAMRAMDDAFKDLEPVLGASNAAAAKENLAVLRDGYQYTAEYFQVDRDAPQAAELSQAGLALVADIERAVGAGDFSGAVTQARALNSNCKSCHDKYKSKKQ